MIEKFKEIFNQIPVVNLVPLFTGFLGELPKRWAEIPEEKKQELFQNLVAAASKAAASYAKKGE